MSGEIVTITCELLSETELAYLVENEDGSFWVPKSKCEYSDGELQIPEWLAIRKDMV